MRKIQKEKLQNIILVFEEAIEEIKTYLRTENIESGINLLIDCQENGYALIDFISESEGKEHKTISVIDNYCKLIFEVHSEIISGDKLNINSIIARLKKSTEKMKKSIDENIDVILEVVFLPYKASMWDSLESVWQAANIDNKCNAVVMPIPYYDKNSDQSFGQLHYEGDDFPQEVPIVHFNQYDIKANEPDIIYIHNPYDNSNFVTSVHPEFYSDNLKKYCELLVYIPYFSISSGMAGKDIIYKSFLYIDYIVTQSKYMQSFYSKLIPNDKFLTLGSPKFDKIVNNSKKNVSIPEEWLIQARNKKVYFFNTSIGGALEDTENYLQKIKYVFEVFEQNSNSCLLWRPHPLLEATLMSMRPQYYEIYYNLKQNFINNNLGIYDDSPSIDEAIAMSDIYIGDSKTSVTSLFSVAGKPLFILNNKIHHLPEKDDWKEMFTVYPGDSRVVNGQYLFSPTNNNYNYKYSLTIPNDDIYVKRACIIDGKTYLTHHLGEHLLVVEGNEIVDKIDLDFSSTGSYSIPLGNYIIIMCVGTSKIIIVNAKNHEVHYIPEYDDICSSSQFDVIKSGGYCLWNNYIVFSSPIKNELLFVDTADYKSEIKKVGRLINKGFNSLVSNDSYIWCLPYEGNIIQRFDPISNEVMEYKDFPNEFKFDNDTNEQPFYSGVVSENELILAPYMSNNFISIDINSDKIKIWKAPFETKRLVKNGYKISDFRKFIFEQQCSKDVYRLNDIQKRKYYEININNKQYTEHSISIDKNEIRVCETGFEKQYELLLYCCIENAFNTLEDLLRDNISMNVFNKEEQLKEVKKISENIDGTAGDQIHKHIVKKIKF